MIRRTLSLALAVTCAMLVTSGTSSAALINFDDQGLTGPTHFFAAGSAQTLSITVGAVTATLAGGVILENTTNLPADPTALYGTASLANPSLTNPLTITFSAPISNFFLDVFNGTNADVSYRVADNLGNAALFSLAPNLAGGTTQIGFAATGTIITVEAVSGLPFFDFFVDNVRFNEDLPPELAPEPASLLLLGSGLLGLGLSTLRRGHRQ